MLLLAAASALPAQPRLPTARVPIVAIDPGHGGADVGARTGGGTLEKQVVLGVALRLRTLIETQHGMRVVLTREDDREVPFDARAAIANNARADVLISLHANAAPSVDAAGAEIYYRLSTPPAQPAPVGPPGSPFEFLPWNEAQGRHAELSAYLALTVRETLNARVPTSPRAAQPAPLRVFAGANMPAVLVELAFLTNGEQEAALTTPEFTEQLVQALSEAVGRFRTFLRTPLAAR